MLCFLSQANNNLLSSDNYMDMYMNLPEFVDTIWFKDKKLVFVATVLHIVQTYVWCVMC